MDAGRHAAEAQLRLGVPARARPARRRARTGPVAGEADHGGLRPAQQPQPVDRRHGGGQPAHRVAGRARRAQVAVVADVPQRRPRRRDRAAGAGRRDHRVDHRVAGPVGVREVLRRAQRRRRGAAAPRRPSAQYAYLCRSTEMLVTPGHREVERPARSTPSRRRYGSAQPPKQASTWQRTPRVGGHRRDLARPGRPRRARTTARSRRPARCPGRSRRPSSAGSGAQRHRVDRHDVERDPQVVRRPWRTRRARSTGTTSRGRGDVGPGVAGGLDREDQRLGAAAGDAADHVRRRARAAAEQPAAARDQGVLHRQQRRERGRVEPVDVRGQRVRRRRPARRARRSAGS